jgi:beta-glucosidase
VSFSHHVRVFDAASSWNPADRLVAAALDEFWNHQPLRSIQEGYIRLSIPFVASYEERCDELRGTLDYLGINYYTRDKVRFSLDAPQKFEIVPPTDRSRMTDVDWEIYPEGLERLLVALQPYGWPLMITENGLADANDSKRARFLCEHVLAMKRAMARGANVIGYVHWSLTDNFEWSLGFTPRFGLVAIDYNTLERTLRPSARIFQAFARGDDPETVCRGVL